jgi:hypothetical protein
MKILLCDVPIDDTVLTVIYYRYFAFYYHLIVCRMRQWRSIAVDLMGLINAKAFKRPGRHQNFKSRARVLLV